VESVESVRTKAGGPSVAPGSCLRIMTLSRFTIAHWCPLSTSLLQNPEPTELTGLRVEQTAGQYTSTISVTVYVCPLIVRVGSFTKIIILRFSFVCGCREPRVSTYALAQHASNIHEDLAGLPAIHFPRTTSKTPSMFSWFSLLFDCGSRNRVSALHVKFAFPTLGRQG
jgi:hypothetical protein